MFKTGFFDLYSIVAGSSTLLITEADGMPSTIPEPATWAMLITGMGFAGGVIRRRRAMAAAG